MRKLLFVVLLLSSASCTTESTETGSGAPDTSGANDVTYTFADPDGSDTKAGPGDTGAPDTSLPDAPDTAIPDTAIPDTAIPDTTSPDATIPDTAIADTSVPDTGSTDTGSTDTTALDTSAPDAGPTCQCDPGTWCNAGTCEACAVDAHCGESCVNCAAVGQVCAADGSGCVQCDEDTPCGSGQQCVSGACVPCNTDKACGPSCLPCAGDTPICQGGACACDASSCGPATTCQNGACIACNLASACGPSCQDCTVTDTPQCVSGSCQCTADAQCGAGKHCVGGGCVSCGDTDPMHCGPSCSVCSGAKPLCSAGSCVCSDTSCGSGSWCSGGSCAPCNNAAHCGAQCVACGGDTPMCVGGACVQCAADGDCGAGSWCSSGQCTPCGASDPNHCGSSCAVCGAGEQCSGGACEPIPCMAQGCATDVSKNAEDCDTARVVGRTNAQAGFLYQSDTTDAGNDDDLDSPFFGGDADCYDAKDDHHYRIYLFQGESIDVALSPQDLYFDIMAKLYVGTVCDSNEDTLISCYNDAGDDDPEYLTYTATQTGWVTIVVDGRYSWDDDWDFGKYAISVKLTCNQPNCCCQ